jgi:transcriptional regulator with XRE-family HTH domain
MNTLGPILRRARLAAGLTLKDVSEASGYSQGALSMIENDQSRPEMERLIRLMDVLRMSQKDKRAALAVGNFPALQPA